MFLICRKIYFAILLKFNHEDAETLSMQKIFSRHYERSEVISKVTPSLRAESSNLKCIFLISDEIASGIHPRNDEYLKYEIASG